MSEVGGAERETYKKGCHEKRPQDAVLEKAEVALEQTHLFRGDYRLFIKVLRTFFVTSSILYFLPRPTEFSVRVLLFMTAGKIQTDRKLCERSASLFERLRRCLSLVHRELLVELLLVLIHVVLRFVHHLANILRLIFIAATNGRHRNFALHISLS